MFRFESLSMLSWLYLVPGFVVCFILFDKLARRRLAKVFGPRLLPYLISSISQTKRRWKGVFQVLVFFIFVLAMARPQMGQSVQEVTNQGFELVLAVDVSESMMAEDIRPNRLEQAKAEMTRLLDDLAGSKIGVIAFAGSAVLISPLTSDPSALKMYIDSLATNSVSSQGTNFESAMKVAKEAFERGGVEKDTQTSVTRAILFASDGEDHEPGAIKIAEELGKSGIRIFSLAYGTESGEKIPVRDKMGFLRGFKKSDGETVITRVNGKALEALAKAGQGSFYFASFGGDHIKKILADFDKLEKTEFESQVATQYDEKYQAFLFLGILIGLIELLLGERRTGFKLWRGRFEVPPA